MTFLVGIVMTYVWFSYGRLVGNERPAALGQGNWVLLNLPTLDYNFYLLASQKKKSQKRELGLIWKVCNKCRDMSDLDAVSFLADLFLQSFTILVPTHLLVTTAAWDRIGRFSSTCLDDATVMKVNGTGLALQRWGLRMQRSKDEFFCIA